MFYLCSQMRWAHLPLAGGIADQQPEVIDWFTYMFVEKGKHEEKERKRNEQKNKSKSKG